MTSTCASMSRCRESRGVTGSSWSTQPIGTGEAADHLALAELPDLFGVGLDHGLADGNLAVAADHDPAALADGQNGGAVPDQGLGG